MMCVMSVGQCSPLSTLNVCFKAYKLLTVTACLYHSLVVLPAPSFIKTAATK